MKKIFLIITLALVFTINAVPLSVGWETGVLISEENERLLNFKTTLYVDIYKSLVCGVSVGLAGEELAIGMRLRYAIPIGRTRIVAKVGAWQFSERMGYIGIGGEIPLKHITFGIGADVGWSRTRSFVCPSAWIVLN